MDLGLKSRFAVPVTLIANEFIDQYMAAANGEYVKVYLYLLRHDAEPVEISRIADALNHTEADVKRALAYWERTGVLKQDELECDEDGTERQDVPEHTALSKSMSGEGISTRASGEAAAASQPAVQVQPMTQRQSAASSQFESPVLPPPADSRELMQTLASDEEFSTLLYAAQQYLGKMFTSIECEKFAYFYKVLKMSGELLEYLAEYCAQNGHTSIRYIEKVAINWYQEGIRTKTEARDYTMKFSSNINAVMNAFGLTNRSPGTAEREVIKKWFQTYGFDRPLVVEACTRTMNATQTPSFQYTDKILSGWKENGVKTLSDVEELDKKRQLAKGQAKGAAREKEQPRKGGAPNRFKNFEERNYDYDTAIYSNVAKRFKKGDSGDGTE